MGNRSSDLVDPVKALVRTIQKAPDNIEAWQVYSDYLQTQNDSHGELIALGIAVEKNMGTRKAKEAHHRFDRIWEDNKEAYLGQAASFINDKRLFTLRWKYGYLLNVRISYYNGFEGPETFELIRAVLQSPVGKFLQELGIGIPESLRGDNVYFTACISELASGGKRESIKKLTIGDVNDEESEISWCSIGDCRKIVSRLINLEQLIVYGANIEFGKLTHTKLKTLHIKTGGLSSTAIESIACAYLPALESLEVWFGDNDYGAEGTIKMLYTLLEGRGYPNLKYLGLMNAEFENDIAKALVDAPIVKQLLSLDLSMGTMTDEGAQAFLTNSESFFHLNGINLSDNFISDKMSSRLVGVYREKVNISRQHNPDEYGVFVSVGR